MRLILGRDHTEVKWQGADSGAARRSVLPAAARATLQPFSPEGHGQSGFNDSIRRMQCDHKPIVRRKVT